MVVGRPRALLGRDGSVFLGRPFADRGTEGSRRLGDVDGEREHKGRSEGYPLPVQHLQTARIDAPTPFARLRLWKGEANGGGG